MARNFRFYFAGFLDGARKIDSFGSLDEPLSEIALTADTVCKLEEVVLAPGDQFTVWEYSADRPYFDFLALWLPDGAGYVEIAWLVDKPTSSSDPTPSAAAKAWNFADLSCFTPFVLSSDDQSVNPVLSDAHSDNSGVPLKWSDAGTVAGRIYKVMVRLSSDATVNVRLASALGY